MALGTERAETGREGGRDGRGRASCVLSSWGRFWPIAIAIALLLMAVMPASARPALSFRLDDQFERHHDAVSLFKAGRPLVFIGGSQRATRDALAKWLGPLRKALGKDAQIVAYLDLRGVPFFVPNCLIRRKLKKAFPKLIVLCDYKGRATNSLGFSPKATLEVRVFDAQGHPRGAVKGPYTVSRLAQVRALVKGILGR